MFFIVRRAEELSTDLIESNKTATETMKQISELKSSTEEVINEIKGIRKKNHSSDLLARIKIYTEQSES